MLNLDNRIESASSIEYDGILSKAVDNEMTRKVETLMLDGSVSVQTIGSPTTRVDVEYYCERPVRRQLQECAATGAAIVVFNEDKIWTGIISGDIKVEPYISNIDEKLTFVLLVTEAADR